jgi:pseudouridine-5'-phosphate glycosidase
VDYRVNDPAQAAEAIYAKFALGIDGAMVIANPVPEADALAAEEIDGVIDTAISDMNKRGISGKESTPFLLARIAEKTGGRSLEANIALVLNNARVAAKIAAHYSRKSL